MIQKIKNFLGYVYEYLTSAINERKEKESLAHEIKELMRPAPKRGRFIELFRTSNNYINFNEFMYNTMKNWEVVASHNLYVGEKLINTTYLLMHNEGQVAIKFTCSLVTGMWYDEVLPDGLDINGDVENNLQAKVSIMTDKEAAQDWCELNGFKCIRGLDVYSSYEYDDPRREVIEDTILEIIKSSVYTPLSSERIKEVKEKYEQDLMKIRQALPIVEVNNEVTNA